MSRIPVILVTGHLGAGKTSLLNGLLRRPGARIGVIVNDFGTINVDAGLVAGQVGDPVSIAGGCVCCLEDTDDYDDALERLSQPRLGLDAIVVEASGIAEPSTLAWMTRHSGAERVRLGGVVEVVDAVEYFETVDRGGVVPARFGVSTLVVINKLDRLAEVVTDETPEQRLGRIEARIREANPAVTVVRAAHGQIDPLLLHDVATAEDPPDELPIAALLRDAHRPDPHAAHSHVHAASVTVSSPAPVDPGRLVDLLEEPPPGAYRIKGTVVVESGRSLRGYVVNVVGRHVHVLPRTVRDPGSELVAIGPELDVDVVRPHLEEAVRPAERGNAEGLRRLYRHRRLSE